MSYDKWFLSEDIAAQYEGLYDRPSTYDSAIWGIEKRILDYVIEKYVPSPCRRTYLDFACGTGRVLSHLEKRFQRVFGVDVSPHMVAFAQQKTNCAEILVGDIVKDSSMLPGPFDVITAFRFFLNAEDALRTRALIALKARMHAGSILVLNNHGSGWSLRSLTIRLQRKLHKSHACEVRQRQFEEMLRTCGFEIVERIGSAILTQGTRNLLGFRITQFIEEFGYRTKIAKWLGSDQIYVVRIRGENHVPTAANRSGPASEHA